MQKKIKKITQPVSNLETEQKKSFVPRQQTAEEREKRIRTLKKFYAIPENRERLLRDGRLAAKGSTSPRKGKTYKEYFGNDRSIEIRTKQSAVKLGKPTWNKGLTKETDKRVADIGVHTGQALRKGLLSGKITPKTNYYKRHYWPDLGHSTRSKWEANVCRIFKHNDIKYKYESSECRFDLGGLGTLIIDFYLPDFSLYIEVKGYLSDNSKKKLNKFMHLFPELNVKIIDNEVYDVLKSKYSGVIEWVK